MHVNDTVFLILLLFCKCALSVTSPAPLGTKAHHPGKKKYIPLHPECQMTPPINELHEKPWPPFIWSAAHAPSIRVFRMSSKVCLNRRTVIY